MASGVKSQTPVTNDAMKPENFSLPGLRHDMSEHTIPFGLVLDSLDEQIALIDRAGRILYVNRAWIEFGISNGADPDTDWVGANYLAPLDILSVRKDAMAADTAQGIRDVIEGRIASFSSEYPCHSPDEKRWFMMRIASLHADSGKLFVISHYNVTARKLSEEKIELLSLQDPLTGILNRRAFDEQLQRAFQHAMRQKDGPLSLLLLDIDHFKAINDEFGHQAGDDHLVRMAQTLCSVIREGVDFAFRLGGDEFAIMIFADQQVACDKAHQILNRMDGQVSIGLASFTPKTPKNFDREAFFRRADDALYEAKRLGRGRVVADLHGPVCGYGSPAAK